jgi:hypothetical protein
MTCFNRTGYMTSNVGMAYFNILSQNLPEGTEENHKKSVKVAGLHTLI